MNCKLKLRFYKIFNLEGVMILFNPVVVSVIVLLALALLKFNIFLALIISAIVGGALAGMPIFAVTEYFSPLAVIPGITADGSVPTVIGTLVGGMGGNSGTALSYIMLGAFAVALAHSGLGTLISRKLSKALSGRRLFMVFSLAFIACFSQNLIPIHIAFIPILIPPLLKLMNSLKLDRRAVAVALTFGLKAPYIALPLGFGAIFRDIVVAAINDNGGNVTPNQATSVMWIGAAAMLVGLIGMGFYYGTRDREYEDRPIIGQVDDENVEVKMNKEAWGALIAAVVTAVASILTQSLPLSALLGLLTMIITGCIKIGQLDEMMDGGIRMMGFIAFVMLIAAGYGAVIRATGAVDTLVESAVAYMQGSKTVAAFVMLLIGLLVTMGIGSSFSTIPIIAAIYVPLAMRLNFSPASIIVLITIAGALGDAGSPASDSTLGPTSGLNADGQHDHIWDTTVPTFLAFNIPLIIGGIIATMILG